MTLLEHHDARVGWGGEGNRVSQQSYTSTNRADAGSRTLPASGWVALREAKSKKRKISSDGVQESNSAKPSPNTSALFTKVLEMMIRIYPLRQ